MLKAFALLALLLLPSFARADACAEYEPAVTRLAGLIRPETYPGAPNYESTAKGDAPERVWILRLRHPLCVHAKKDPLYEEESQLSEIQLVLTRDQYLKYKNQRGKEVWAEGTLFHAHTGHHHADVLMTVSGIEDFNGNGPSTKK
ncbi:MAG: DUF4431 domain-containing protein [bacterium]